MFGYVKVNSAELKVKEYEAYRAAYCGLCRSMGKCTGQCSRLSLSYDFAFLVALRMCLTDTKMSFSQKRCFVHPLKKRSVMDRNEQLDICAGAAAILAYHKIMDDLADEKGIKRIKPRLAYPFVKRWRKKAVRLGLEELDLKISDALKRLSELEKKSLPSVDAPAAVFGEILGDISAFGISGARERIARSIGKSVGKWIYITDALDDCAEDKDKGSYNPFLLLYNGRAPEERELESISDALKLELCEAEAAMDLLETDKPLLKDILENILYLGMPQTVEKVVCKENEKAKKPKKKGKLKNERSI